MNASPPIAASPLPKLSKSLVLIGMPGAGKSSVGKKLAKRLGVPFADSDAKIEEAAGMRVEEIFARLGEPAFREGERRVIARLLEGPPCVLSTGGGAFMDETTRALIREKGISVWLRADFDILLERVMRNTNRPLLQKKDPAAALRELQDKREPVYATADVEAVSNERPAEETVERVLRALAAYLSLPERSPQSPSS
jgi:shikimate kinase